VFSLNGDKRIDETSTSPKRTSGKPLQKLPTKEMPIVQMTPSSSDMITKDAYEFEEAFRDI